MVVADPVRRLSEAEYLENERRAEFKSEFFNGEMFEAYDRGKKFENYRQIPSLQEYLLVSQKEPRIEQFIRQPDGGWLLRTAAGPDARLELPSLGITLQLAEVFARVEFTHTPLRDPTASARRPG
jgi:Uma2 family endonuclease